MIKKSLLHRVAAVAAGSCLVALALPVEQSHAYEPPEPGAGICFGGFAAQPFFADVVPGTPGQELVLLNVDETIKADSDLDGLREVLSEVRAKVVDRSGNVLWTSPRLGILGPDTATVALDTYFLSGLGSDTFAAGLFIGGQACYGVAFAVEAGGQKYVAVVAGFLSQTGMDEATGTDESKINVWILNAATGAVVKRHILRPRNDKYLMGISLAGLGLLDADADDELVISYAIPTGGGRYTILVESYNVLTGAQEDRWQAFMRNTRTFE